mmetsp:Transcript_38874/g.64116  ORF Transcript_38874/g.64116 Transcript_38874/m.64116 type:complete len:82 (+) Transcript_38874:212-457(+)
MLLIFLVEALSGCWAVEQPHSSVVDGSLQKPHTAAPGKMPKAFSGEACGAMSRIRSCGSLASQQPRSLHPKQRQWQHLHTG